MIIIATIINKKNKIFYANVSYYTIMLIFNLLLVLYYLIFNLFKISILYDIVNFKLYLQNEECTNYKQL